MYDKQEMFEAFCEYCAGTADDDSMAGWPADMKMQFLKDSFEYYFSFFKEYIQRSPGSS